MSDFHGFHDCKLGDVRIDFEHAMLTLLLIDPCDGARFTVTFRGFLALSFEDVVCGCVIFDIETISADDALTHYRQVFTSRKNYGWPFPYADDADFRSKLDACVVSQISSSYGLSGFVVSKFAPTVDAA